MKKVIIFAAIIVVLLGGLAVVTQMQQKQQVSGDNPYDKDSLHPETIKQLDDPNYQSLIMPDEMKQKIEDKETFVTYFFSPTCPHCKETTPILMPAAEEQGVEINQYNLLEYEQGWEEHQIEETPTLVFYENGKEVDRIVGTQDAETFEDLLSKWKEKDA
ncbi:thioredoxin family protein [Metabacillus arenae]|uniref:Thioredoxin n=1 Tax=Metabacillus arenae TaxID=2771434 RepID=A0A926NK82_9BACI|nr:thioredoxin family protein [Metabacillus arenae]MBD1382290.1 thioredoxin family protein [Metabacillus arenae]